MKFYASLLEFPLLALGISPMLGAPRRGCGLGRCHGLQPPLLDAILPGGPSQQPLERLV